MLLPKSLVGFGLAIFFCIEPQSSALARDLEMLARVLIPAYMAQNFAVLCATKNPDFLSGELGSGVGSVTVYAEHVKKEVTGDIPEPDAAQVRVTAADTARQVARRELYDLAAQQGTEPTRAVERWCERSAKPFILEIMRKHEENHGRFDEIVENAKR